MSDIDDFFRNQMADVKPIKKDRRVVSAYKSEATPGLERRRAAAEAEVVSDSNLLSGGDADGSPVDLVDPLAVLEFKRDGVQHGVYKSLRLGKYQVEARLDLHRTNVEEARRLVFEFIRDCREHDVRCALITHGKGEGRQSGAVLKSCVAHWLPQMDEVLAFHSAQKHHGGVGATYVMLKKSEKKRQQNMEMHARRRT